MAELSTSKTRLSIRIPSSTVSALDAYASANDYASRSHLVRDTLDDVIEKPDQFDAVSGQAAANKQHAENMDYRIEKNSDDLQSMRARLDEMESAISGMQAC